MLNGANLLGMNCSCKIALVVVVVGTLGPFGWNYKPAEKHCWLIFCERKILFRLKKQAE
jgi:hypothetical protein